MKTRRFPVAAAAAAVAALLGALAPARLSGPDAGSMPTARAAASARAAAAPARITEAQMRRLLNEWLAAQNRHSFSRYSRLYAGDFTGIKRVTSGRVREYGRAGWLSDRRSMLSPSRHLHLSAENVRLRPLQGGWGEIRFDQYFRSRKYGDWGPKLLRVRRTAGGLQIVHEELLASHRLVEECGC